MKLLLKEKFNKSELSKLRSIVKKELEVLKKKEIESFIKKEIQTSVKKLSIKDIDSKFDENVEDIFREMMQKYHEMFYREKHIIRNKLKL